MILRLFREATGNPVAARDFVGYLEENGD